MNVFEELVGLADSDYKQFNHKIIPTAQEIMGVRTPALRKIARKIVRSDPLAFIDMEKNNIYEMIMLEGMTLSYMDKSFIELLPLTERFLEKVDNWAQVDSTVCDFQRIASEKENVLTVVEKWLRSDKEFIVRAGLVILIAHYIEKERLPAIFTCSQAVAHTGYYVYMANAWLISVCMAKFPDETLSFFQDNTLDKRTHNKAIQKSRESYRVSGEHKALLLELRR